MLRRLRDSELSSQTDEIRGSTLYGSDHEKIGTIEDVLFDPDSSVARYAIVDSGGWLSSRKFLVPTDAIHADVEHPNDFHVPLTKNHVQSLPTFSEDLLDSENDFIGYESRYRTQWNSYGFTTPTERHPRMEHFESGIRNPVVEPISRPTTSPSSVYGVFDSQDKLERAVDKLKQEGFQSSDISVVFPEKGRTERFAVEHATKAPEGAATGGGTGIVVGGVLGWLAGIGTLAIPGIGPLLAAGPIVAALAGAGVGGAVGGIAGALIGMGLPELEAKRYENEIRAGRILVSVRCADPRFIPAARAILESADARDVFQTGEKKAA